MNNHSLTDQTNSSQGTQGTQAAPATQNGEKYLDLMQYIREIVSLRNKLVSQKCDDKDIESYKLLTKVFGAYYRIKGDPNIIIDSISKLDTSTAQTQTQVQQSQNTQVQNTSTTPIITYMFDDNDDKNKNDKDSDLNDDSDDRDIDELFASDDENENENEDNEKLAEDAEKMYKTSEILMKKAIESKKYVAKTIDEDMTDENNTIKQATPATPATPATQMVETLTNKEFLTQNLQSVSNKITNNFKVCNESYSDEGSDTSSMKSPKMSDTSSHENGFEFTKEKNESNDDVVDLTYVGRGRTYTTYKDIYDEYERDMYGEYYKSEDY